MTKSFSTQSVSLALAALLTLAMLAGTNALAGHQYRVAAAAAEAQDVVAMATQHVVVVGHRVANV